MEWTADNQPATFFAVCARYALAALRWIDPRRVHRCEGDLGRPHIAIQAERSAEVDDDAYQRSPGAKANSRNVPRLVSWEERNTIF